MQCKPIAWKVEQTTQSSQRSLKQVFTIFLVSYPMKLRTKMKDQHI